MAAGVAANIVLAWSCLFASGLAVGVPVFEPTPVIVNRVVPSSVAEAAGFRAGDQLVAVKGERMDGVSSALDRSLTSIRGSVGKRTPFDATVKRGATEVPIRVPALPRDSKSLGVELTQPAGKPLGRMRLGPAEAASRAVRAVYRELRVVLAGVLRALASLAPGGAGTAELQGPIGIARMGGDLASTDALRLLEFGALLSVNLAVFNSLPLPGLDGWQLSVLAIESLLRKPIPEALRESADALAGLLFLYAFSRVLLSDVQGAVGGPAFDAVGSGIAGAARELGPSILIGFALLQVLRARTNGQGAEDGGVADSRARGVRGGARGVRGGVRSARASNRGKRSVPVRKPSKAAGERGAPRRPFRSPRKEDNERGRWWRW